MRCGMTLFIQGYEDWERYLARERGEAVAPMDPDLDRKRLSGEIETALEADRGWADGNKSEKEVAVCVGR